MPEPAPESRALDLSPTPDPSSLWISDLASAAPSEDASPWRATGQESPVFLDRRGHRGLVTRALGIVGGLVSAGALAVIVTAALAFGHVSPLAKEARTSVSAARSTQPAVGRPAGQARSQRPRHRAEEADVRQPVSGHRDSGRTERSPL